MARAFIFPGQGSQAVGMGQELAEASTVARHLFQEIDDALSQHLTRLMFEGPEDELRLTENAQPALMAVSLAVVRVLEQEAGIDLAEAGELVAGHSLGEYSALAAVGAFEVAEAARLLKRRGQAMQAAVPVGEGAMAALLGLDLEAAAAVAEAAAQGEVCAPANDNAPGQVVVSGHKTAVERALEVAAEQGARKGVLLPVSAPFHCALMAPAAEAMAEALDQTPPREPRLPLVSNVSAAAVTDPEAIRDLLVQQVTDMVRWRESVLFIKAQGVDTLVELGAGNVLTGLTRRIDRELTGLAVGGPGDVETLQKLL
ncbi:MAG: ACP S-malonyltransferase [Kiloniellales bacterium]|nr:ACP S-malonyltransferase [Kiloniellales bacterium]